MSTITGIIASWIPCKILLILHYPLISLGKYISSDKQRNWDTCVTKCIGERGNVWQSVTTVMSRTSTDLPDAFWRPENRNGPFFFLNSCNFFYSRIRFMKKMLNVVFREDSCFRLQNVHSLDRNYVAGKKRNYQRPCLCNVCESHVKWFSENIYSQNGFQIICWNILPPPQASYKSDFYFLRKERVKWCAVEFWPAIFFLVKSYYFQEV